MVEQKIYQINTTQSITKNAEGKLLMAAIAKITTESQTDKTPDEVILQLNELSEKMFLDETET